MAVSYRFLIVNENYLGHQTVHKLLCEQLARNADIDFDTITLDSVHSLRDRLHRALACLRFVPGQWLQRQNLDWQRFRFQWYVATIARERVLQQLARHHYNAIHFHSQTAALRCGDIIRKIPALISTDITNTQASREWNHPLTRWTYLPNRWMEGYIFKDAACIASFSEWTRRWMLREHPKLCPDKIVHFPPGADLSAFAQIPVQRPVKDKLQILFVGGDFPRKGGFDLLHCFETHFQAHFQDRCELHLVTSYPLSNLPPGVFVYSDIRPYSAELIERYRQADLYVMPTTNEAYGHVFIEAMASGLPVVATHINAIPEIIADGETGILIPPGDTSALKNALQQLIDDPALRLRMGEAGRLRAITQFDAHTCYQRYVDALKDISAPMPHAPPELSGATYSRR